MKFLSPRHPIVQFNKMLDQNFVLYFPITYYITTLDNASARGLSYEIFG